MKKFLKSLVTVAALTTIGVAAGLVVGMSPWTVLPVALVINAIYVF